MIATGPLSTRGGKRNENFIKQDCLGVKKGVHKTNISLFWGAHIRSCFKYPRAKTCKFKPAQWNMAKEPC